MLTDALEIIKTYRMKNKNSRRKLYGKRTFLNPESNGGLAAIDAIVEVIERKTEISVNASLGFADCSHQIYLDFDIWNSSETKRVLRERRKKIEHIRTVVNNFLDACEKAYKEVEGKAPEKQKAKKKDEKK